MADNFARVVEDGADVWMVMIGRECIKKVDAWDMPDMTFEEAKEEAEYFAEKVNAALREVAVSREVADKMAEALRDCTVSDGEYPVTFRQHRRAIKAYEEATNNGR